VIEQAKALESHLVAVAADHRMFAAVVVVGLQMFAEVLAEVRCKFA
jgi:hypothetical protein